MEISRDHDMTPSEARIEDQELQEILDRENPDLEKLLEQGTIIGVTPYQKRIMTECDNSFYADHNGRELEPK